MKEIWKNINGYNGEYQISNLARVKSFKHKNDTVIKFIDWLQKHLFPTLIIIHL